MLDALKGRFWTKVEEMAQDFEEVTGYEVVEATPTHIVLVGENDEEFYIGLVLAGKTMAIHHIMKVMGGDDDDEL